MNKSNNYVYHYYFNVFNDNKEPEMIVRKELYTTELTMRKVPFYVVHANSDKIRLYNLDKDFNKVINGRTIYMKERNDEMAKELFSDYLTAKIAKLRSETNRLLSIYRLVESNNIKEGNIDE